MKKKALSLALALVMCLGLMAVPVLAADIPGYDMSDPAGRFTLTRTGDGSLVKEKATLHWEESEHDHVINSHYLIAPDTSWTLSNVGAVTNDDFYNHVTVSVEPYFKQEGIYRESPIVFLTNNGDFASGYEKWEAPNVPLSSGESLTFTWADIKAGLDTLGRPEGASEDVIYVIEIDSSNYLTQYYYMVRDGSGTTTSTEPQQPAGNATASPTNDKLEVNGAAADPTVYKINGSNYFKIRDVAALLNGTEKQFAVGYDGEKNAVTATTGQGYAKQSGDLAGAAKGGDQSAAASNDAIYVNGEKITAEVYKINGSNYFKLRDLGKALDFYVGWSAERGMYIETDKPYSE